MESAPSPPAARAGSFPFCWLAGIVVVAMVARAWLQFHTSLAPGINGAYYFVQARAVLEQGMPGMPDLPLTFWMQAGLAWLVQHFGGLARDPAIVLAVKVADSCLPALGALPIAWLGWRWHRPAGQPSALAALAPAALVCLGAQALSMTGDFQKNALALVWLAALGPAAHLYLTRPGIKTALAQLVLFALLGLTHVGVLGASLVFTFLLAAGATFTAPARIRRRILGLALVGAVIFGFAGTVIYRSYDSARIRRLLGAFTEPSSFVDSGSPRPPDGQDRSAGSDNTAVQRDQRMPGGPPGGSGLLARAPGLAMLALALGGLAAMVAGRKRWPPADQAVLLAAAVTTAILGGPFFSGDKAQRLMLIAAVPAAMTLSFLLAAITNHAARRAVGVLVLVGTLVSAALYLPHAGRPTITPEAYAELQTLTRFTQPAEHTLIVARHGLEWWTAWALHTHIAQPQAVTTSDWTKYDRVVYLAEKQRSGPPGGFRPLDQSPPGQPSTAWDDHPDDRPGPPPGARPGDPTHGFPGGGAGSFSLQVPDDAKILHDGVQLTLALAARPPQALEPNPGIKPGP